MRYITLIIGITVAYLLIRYRKVIHDFTGEFGFAEKYLGSGGTYTFIVLFGIIIFIGSVMNFFGTLDGFLESTIGRLI